MDDTDTFLLWSRALRGMALIVLLIFLLPLPLLYFGWFVTSWEDVGGGWQTLIVPLSLSLLLWLTAWVFERKAKARRPE